MKICHVITRLIVGGAQENTVLTCRGLVERGHEVTLVAGTETGPEGSLWPEAKASGATLIGLDDLRRDIAPTHDLRAAAALRRHFIDDAPDIVHTHSSKAGILARRAADRAKVPVVVHTIHGMSFNRTQSWWRRRMYRALERRAARWTTAFVTVADAMIDQAVAAGLAPCERFTTIRSGMETERFAPDPAERARTRAAWGMRDDDTVVGTIARLFDNKGYDELLAAMPRVVAQAPGTRFVWVGDGARRVEYEARLHAMGLRDRVQFTGLVSPEAIPALVRGFDLLVHASRWEGLPRAVVQALLCSVPVVCTDNDGAREVVLPGKTGELVPDGDAEALARAVVNLIESPDRRSAYGTQGRRLCLSLFDWHDMVRQIAELYDRLLAKRSVDHAG